MASANLVFPLMHPINPRFLHTPSPPQFLLVPRFAPSRNGFSLTATRAVGDEFLGDFGARDPFPAELESGFGEKVLGNVDTEHKILIPNISALSLSQQECTPISPLQSPISEDDAQKLIRKVPTQCPISCSFVWNEVMHDCSRVFLCFRLVIILAF